MPDHFGEAWERRYLSAEKESEKRGNRNTGHAESGRHGSRLIGMNGVSQPNAPSYVTPKIGLAEKGQSGRIEGERPAKFKKKKNEH